jgi:hypothetical protein
MRRSYDTKSLGACKHIDLKIRMEVVLYKDHSYHDRGFVRKADHVLDS